MPSKGSKKKVTAPAEAAPVAPVAKKGDTGVSSMVIRSVAAIFLFLCLCSIIYLGHHALSVAVFLLEAEVFRELLNVRYKSAKELEIPWFRAIHWCLFLVGTFYMHGATSMRNLLWLEPVGQYFQVILNYHNFLCTIGYAAVFVIFTLSLKKGVIKYQIGQMAWSMLILFFIVFQTRAIIYNLFNGLFWFLYPLMLVACNDTCAYFCGKAFGKKFISQEFLALSPNKTWEGFIGGGLCTILFGFFFSRWLGSIKYFACPYGQSHCTLNKVFIPTPHTLANVPVFDWDLGLPDTVTIAPIQYHGVLMALFASLVAPFGGFFASAIKRAYDLKDFSTIIPGHGGFMDRVDCQFIMALYVWVHCNTFITSSVTTLVGTVAVLDKHVQQDFVQRLRDHLVTQGVLGPQ